MAFNDNKIAKRLPDEGDAEYWHRMRNDFGMGAFEAKQETKRMNLLEDVKDCVTIEDIKRVLEKIIEYGI